MEKNDEINQPQEPVNGEIQPGTTETPPVENPPAKPDTEKNGQTANVTPRKPATLVPPIEIEPNGKVSKQKDDSGKNRLTFTVNFSGDEVPYVQEIIKARIESGITNNNSHFIRQCVDFAINHRPGTTFAKPDISPVEIKDAFYNPVINKE